MLENILIKFEFQGHCLTRSLSYECKCWAIVSLFNTHLSQWTLVCDRRWMGALAQSIYMSGLLIGAVMLGNSADRFGRKPVFFAAAVLQLVVGTVVAFVPDFYSFLVLRFLYGVGTVGTLSSSFVLSEYNRVGRNKFSA